MIWVVQCYYLALSFSCLIHMDWAYFQNSLLIYSDFILEKHGVFFISKTSKAKLKRKQYKINNKLSFKFCWHCEGQECNHEIPDLSLLNVEYPCHLIKKSSENCFYHQNLKSLRRWFPDLLGSQFCSNILDQCKPVYN